MLMVVVWVVLAEVFSAPVPAVALPLLLPDLKPFPGPPKPPGQLEMGTMRNELTVKGLAPGNVSGGAGAVSGGVFGSPGGGGFGGPGGGYGGPGGGFGSTKTC